VQWDRLLARTPASPLYLKRFDTGIPPKMPDAGIMQSLKTVYTKSDTFRVTPDESFQRVAARDSINGPPARASSIGP